MSTDPSVTSLRRGGYLLGSAALLVLGLLAGTAATAPPARAATVTETAPTDPNVFVACGYGSETLPGGGTCPSLPDVLARVLADNGASAPAATIELAPGDYCPIDINTAAAAADPNNKSGTLYRTVRIVGIGEAWFQDDSGPTTLDGFEAALSSFRWSSTYCGSGSSELISIVGGYDYSTLTLQNLAVDGSPNGDSDGAPDLGIYAQDVNLTLRDVLVENNTDIGLEYGSGENTSMQVNGGAFVDNGTGVEMGSDGTVESSTIAGNTVGLWGTGPYVHLYDDTITANDTGIYSGGFGFKLGVTDTIVLGNSANCSVVSSGWWEEGEGASGHNLIGPNASDGTTYSCGVDNGDAADDVKVASDVHVGSRTTGGLTPYYPAPEEAGDQGELCPPTDQREAANDGDGCDIGSINRSGGSPAPGTSPASSAIDLGSVQVGDSDSESVGVGASSGVVGVGDISLDDDSGAFTLAANGNGCTFAALVPSTSCRVVVEVTPPSAGTFTATLTDATTAGPVTFTLSVTGTPPPPSALTVTRFDDPEGAGVCVGGGSDDCSLRQAVDSLASGGTITVPAGTYTLTQGELDVGAPMTIAGAGATDTVVEQASDGGHAVLAVQDADGVTVSGLELTRGTGYQGRDGGGVYADDATLDLDHVLVEGNTAGSYGAGVAAGDSELTIDHSAVLGNTLTGDSGNSGGGVYVWDSGLTLVDSTLAGNDAGAGTDAEASSGDGGALFADGSSAVDISFTTIYGNVAYDTGGVVDNTSVGEEEDSDSAPVGVSIRDSVLAANTATDGTGDCGSSTLISGGHNYVYDADAGAGAVPCGLDDPSDIHGPALSWENDQAGDNGGQTPTVLPAADSPLVDAAGDADCAGVGTDQRDVSRPQGAHCDIGAVEVEQQPSGGSTGSSGSSSTPPPPPSEKSAQVITFPALSGLTYGDGPVALGGSASSGLPVSYASGTPGVCTVARGRLRIVAAGSCTVTASQGGDGDYAAAAPVTRTVTIARARLVITASDASVYRGVVAPVVRPLYRGLVAGDLAPAVPPTCGAHRASMSTSCRGAADPDYAIAYRSGKLTRARPQRITLRVHGDLRYGSHDAVVHVASNSHRHVTVTSGPAGVCRMDHRRLVFTGAGVCVLQASMTADIRWAAATTTQTVIVARARLRIIASDATMARGGPVPLVSASYRGFVDGDHPRDLATAPTCAAHPRGRYTHCWGAASRNYRIHYIRGILVIRSAGGPASAT